MPVPGTAPAEALSRAERCALGALGVEWVVPAWWLGASTVAGQTFAAAAGLVALGLAIGAARVSAWPASPAAEPRFSPFVVFCVAAFLALVLSQALNPDRLLTPDRHPVGPVTPLPHWAALPTGIAGPFDRLPGDFLGFANAWRQLLVAAAAALPLAALAALRHRLPVLRAALGLLAVHAAVFSAFAFVHNLSGSRAVLWLVSDASFHLGAPQFPFKNQQAAYQVLLLALTLAAWLLPAPLRPWPQLRHRQRWGAVLGLVVFLGTITTRSRAGMVAATLLVLAAGAIAYHPRRRRREFHLRPAVLAIATLLGAAGLSQIPPVRATLLRFAEIAQSPRDLLSGGSYRRILHDIAWQMTLDRPWLGHGAGCYVILFPEYQKRVPAFAEAVRRFQPDWNRPVHVHADSDWLEFTAEYGLVGTALFAAPWIVWLAALRQARSTMPALLLLAAGPLFVLVHGWIDFVLRNPAILGLAATCALIALGFARAVRPSRDRLSA